MTLNSRLIIGVDEVGRGPLAGPVTLSAFIAPAGLKKKLIVILGGKIKDSKQFSGKKREEIYKQFLILRKASKIFFSVSHVSNKIIDKKGISFATRKGIEKCLKKLQHTSKWQRESLTLRLDGLLKAPEEFKNQKTIIKGDEKDVFIACASIVAKVRRDRLLRRLSAKYPKYGFEIHKGYGTKLHYRLIRKHGISGIHRISFLKNLQPSPVLRTPSPSLGRGKAPNGLNGRK